MSSPQANNPEAHEGDWLYVSGPLQIPDKDAAVALYESIAGACESAGWHVVRPYREVSDAQADREIPLFERLHRALEHADACIVYVGRPSSGVGAEIAFAYEHGRPILGVQLEGDVPSPFIASLLAGYERARLVTCRNADDCAERVRETLRAPDFADLMRAATAEHAEDV